MISLDKITKIYASGAYALRDVSFSVAEGEMVFLTGDSGSGKTSLFSLLMQLTPVTRGRILIDGQDITRLPNWQLPYIRRKMAVISKDQELLPKRTVFENVAMPLIVTGYRGSEIKSRVPSLLDKLDLLDKKKTYPEDLSAGEKQRVLIARALVTYPRILLADEPTFGCHLDLSKQIMDLFLACESLGMTIILATHHLSLLAPFQRRVLTLKSGYLLEKEAQ